MKEAVVLNPQRHHQIWILRTFRWLDQDSVSELLTIEFEVENLNLNLNLQKVTASVQKNNSQRKMMRYNELLYIRQGRGT